MTYNKDTIKRGKTKSSIKNLISIKGFRQSGCEAEFARALQCIEYRRSVESTMGEMEEKRTEKLNKEVWSIG